MDRITKFLRRLNRKEQEHVLKIIHRLEQGETQGLDVKKLTGRKDIFRIRVGSIRIIVLRMESHYRVISIERRSDTTYNV